MSKEAIARIKINNLLQKARWRFFDDNTGNAIKKIKIPMPDLEKQNKIIQMISKEKLIIDQNKELIEIFERKIQDRINEVWGE